MIKRQGELEFKSNAGEVKAQVDSLKNSTDNLANTNKKNSASLVDSNNSMKLADSLTGGLASKIKGAADSTGLFSVAQKALAIATEGGTTAMKVFQIALASTGIGLIVIAVGLLIDYFKDFDPLIDKIEQGMAAFGAAIRVVEQALGSLFSSSEDSSESFKNLGDNMAKAANDAAKLKEAQQDLEDAMNSQDVANARASQRYTELILQSKNRTLSEKERIDLIKQADKIETDNFNQRKTLADKEVLQAREAARIKGALNEEEMDNLKKKGVAYAIYLQNLGKITDKEVEAIKKSQLNRIQIDSENTARSEKAQNRRDALEDAQKAKDEKREADAKAKRDKAAEVQKANDDKYNAYKLKSIKEVQDLEDDTEEKKFLRKKQRDLEELNAIKVKNAEEYNILKAAYDEKYKLLEQSIENKKNREEAEAKAKAAKDKETTDAANLKELTDLIAKNQVTKSLSDAKTAEEVHDIGLKNQILLDNQERAEITKAVLLGASSEQLQVIRDNYDKKEIDNTKATTEAKKKIADLEEQQQKKKVAAIGQTLKTAASLLGEHTAAGKALAIAGATIDTFQSSVSAYKGMVAAIPGPVGVAAGAVAAAAAIATGLATVKQIVSVKVPGAGGGGGASAPSAPSQPSVSFQNTPQSQISDTINEASKERNSQPIKTFVAIKDVNTAQELDRNIAEANKY